MHDPPNDEIKVIDDATFVNPNLVGFLGVCFEVGGGGKSIPPPPAKTH